MTVLLSTIPEMGVRLRLSGRELAVGLFVPRRRTRSEEPQVKNKMDRTLGFLAGEMGRGRPLAKTRRRKGYKKESRARRPRDRPAMAGRRSTWQDHPLKCSHTRKWGCGYISVAELPLGLTRAGISTPFQHSALRRGENAGLFQLASRNLCSRHAHISPFQGSSFLNRGPFSGRCPELY